MKIRILIADPIPLVRRGLSAVLASEPDFHIVGEAEDAAQTAAKAVRLRPDIVLSEYHLMGGDITNICATIGSEGLASRVVVLSESCDGEYVSQAVSSGAAGYMSKHEPTSLICAAIRRIAAGHPVFSDDAQLGLQLFLQLQVRRPEVIDDHDQCRPLLTERELQVLQCIAEGMSVEETGAKLHTSLSTVKNFRQSIFVKLNAPNAPGAVYEAMHRGLLR